MPPPHTPRGVLATAALLAALNQIPDGNARGLLFLAFTSMLVELHPLGGRPEGAAMRVEYNVLDALARHVGRLRRSLAALTPALADHADRARLRLRERPGLDLAAWPADHGALVCLDLHHLTCVSPLTLASLWADGLRTDTDVDQPQLRFFPRRPPFTPDLERLGPDPLEVVCSELSRVLEPDGNLFLGCGGITDAGMLRLLVGLRQAGLEVKGPLDPGGYTPDWHAPAGHDRASTLLHARKPRPPRSAPPAPSSQRRII